MKSKLELGVDGIPAVNQSALNTTCSSMDSPDINESKSSELLPWLSATDGSLKELMGPWLVNRQKFHRPCGSDLPGERIREPNPGQRP